MRERPKTLLDSLSQAAKDELLQRVYQDYEWAAQEREQEMTDWKDSRDQYDSEWVNLTGTEDDENLDQYFYVPMTYSVIHRVECALRSHFLPPGDRRLGRITGTVTGYGVPLAAEIVDQVVHAVLDIDCAPVRQLQDTWNSALVEGTGVLRVRWDMARHVPQLDWVPLEHCCWDPSALTPNEVRFWCQERWLTEDELWKMELAGVYRDVKEIGQCYAEDARDDEWRQTRSTATNRARHLYKIVEFWGSQQLVEQQKLDAMHEKGQHRPQVDIVATFHRDKVLLQCAENTYARLFDNPTPLEKLPVFITCALPKKGSTYGDSLTKRLQAIQREINALRNQRRQAVDMEMTRKVFVDRNRGIDMESLEAARYGGAVPCDGDPHSAVYDFAPQTSTQIMAQEEAIVESDARHLSGVMESHMGETPSGADTATGISIITQEGNVKLDNILQNIADSQVVPLLRFIVECVKEWMPPDKIADIIGSKNPPPPLKDVLRHDYRVEVESGVSATSKAVRLRNMQAGFQTLGQIANAMPQPALAAMMAILPEWFRLQQLPQVIPIFEQYAEQLQGAMGPAGAQQPAMSNMQNDQAMAMQGRSPMPEEQRMLPMGRGR